MMLVAPWPVEAVLRGRLPAPGCWLLTLLSHSIALALPPVRAYRASGAAPAAPRVVLLPHPTVARSLLLIAATVLVSLAVVHLLVRADVVAAGLWSYYPVLLAACLALLFGIRALRRPSAAGGES